MAKVVEPYLTSYAMKAMASSLELAATVTRFEIVELWTVDENGKYYCPYVHATDELRERYPGVIHGHHPKTKEHVLSPKLCEYAKLSSKRYHWRVFPDTDRPSDLYASMNLPIKTEMAYHLEGETGGVNVYIVGLSLVKLVYKTSSIKFLSGLGYAIYIAAFNIDEDDETPSVVNDGENNKELDHKEFVPANRIVTPFTSAANLAALGHNRSSQDQLVNMGKWGRTISDANLKARTAFIVTSRSSDQGCSSYENSVGLSLGDSPVNSYVSPTAMDFEAMDLNREMTDSCATTSIPTITESSSQTNTRAASCYVNDFNGAVSLSSSSSVQLIQRGCSEPTSPSVSSTNIMTTTSDPIMSVICSHSNSHNNYNNTNGIADIMIPRSSSMNNYNIGNAAPPPTWEPAYVFSFPVGEMPVKHSCPDDLTFQDFTDIKHIADGSNSNIFLAKMKQRNNEIVVIKMIKEEVETEPIAVHEFDLEYGMLSRISHPHIIRILGAGNEPRRFMVLEYLSGGSLSNYLAEHQSRPGMLSVMLFRKPSFTYVRLLSRAKDMAEALDYLHYRCHLGASIIHRDLKPDNVGFTADGTLKLFDFGLVTCVRAREQSSQSYHMTGYTGSLRYMAPEVALREAYNEKVDVYSFGIMLWQMARDRIPFLGLGKTTFMQDVVRGGQRPKLDKSWPVGFSSLLTSCWMRTPDKRPSFAAIIVHLSKLIDEACDNKNQSKRGRINKSSKSIHESHNSWF